MNTVGDCIVGVSASLSQASEETTLHPHQPEVPPPVFLEHLQRFRFTTPTLSRLPSSAVQVSAGPPSVNSPRRRAPPTRRGLSTPRLDGGSPYFPAESPDAVGATLEEQKPAREREHDDDSPSPKKKRKKPSRPYAEPSVYADLDLLSDILADNLRLVFIGINPGVMSARTGHHYASPTNHFWKVLHGAGFTNRRLAPSEGHLLPSFGPTHFISRLQVQQSELSKEEMRACVPGLLRKLVRHRPAWVAFVGMAICEVVERWLQETLTGFMPLDEKTKVQSPRKKTIKVTPGRRPFLLAYEVDGVRKVIKFFALPSTSARVVAYQIEDKIRLWKDLKHQLEDGNEMGAVDTVTYSLEDVLSPAVASDEKSKLEATLGQA